MKVLSAGSLLVCSSALYASPLVTGNTISWPDDGWYQVQDATDYSQICAGVQSCAVEPGTYIVINHTTGQRFEDVVVGGDSDGNDSEISVSGGLITWPDDGWYQVQRSDTYESICNGGSSCTVANGSYIVINHTTGRRYPIIDVTDVDTPADADATINSANYKDVIASVLKVYSGLEYADTIFALPEFLDVDAETDSGEYECETEGSFTIDTFNTTRGLGFDLDSESCMVGAITIVGDITAYEFAGSENRRSDSFVETAASKYGPYVRQSLSGEASRTSGQWVAVDLNYFYHQGVDISDGNFYWGRNISSGGSFSMSIDGSFDYADSLSLSDEQLSADAVGMSIQLSPDETWDLRGDHEFLDPTPFKDVYPEEGTITISAEDGSTLLMNAATGDMNTVSITIDNAEESVSLLDNWSDWSTELRTDALGATR